MEYVCKNNLVMKKIWIMALLAVQLVSCGDNARKEEEARKQAVLEAQQRQLDSMRLVMEKQRFIDSINEVNAARAAARQKTRTVVRQSSSSQHQGAYAGDAPADNTTTRKRDGWSAKAKGAVIGAGAGAVTGALVDKRKGEGAIIGGLAGAAVGLGTGAIIDDAQKKKEEEAKKKKK